MRRDRRFRPTLGTECLEPRALLDGSGSSMPTTDEWDLAEQFLHDEMMLDQSIVGQSEVQATFNCGVMPQLQKDILVQEIEDIRTQFNLSINAAIASDADKIIGVGDVLAGLDAKIASLTIDLANPKSVQTAEDFLQARDNIQIQLNDLKTHQDKLFEFKKYVNDMADKIIRNIKGEAFVMYDGDGTPHDITQDTNDAFYAST